MYAHKARRRTTYNPYKRNVIHSIEVLYEEMLWQLYKITNKAFTTFPKLHIRERGFFINLFPKTGTRINRIKYAALLLIVVNWI